MNQNLIIKEEYKKGNDVINYIVNQSTKAAGNDQVLQHKLLGITEAAHVTLHPDGTVNFREVRTKSYLDVAIKNGLIGYVPNASINAKQFLTKIRGKI